MSRRPARTCAPSYDRRRDGSLDRRRRDAHRRARRLHDGARKLQGYVESSLGEAATRVQLLALALDASGNVTAQRVAWLPESIGAGGRAYFDIPKMPPAAEYRVSVWSFDRLKGGSM